MLIDGEPVSICLSSGGKKAQVHCRHLHKGASARHKDATGSKATRQAFHAVLKTGMILNCLNEPRRRGQIEMGGANLEDCTCYRAEQMSKKNFEEGGQHPG